MIKFINQIRIFGVYILLTSCATTMTPLEVNRTLPTLTVSKSLTHVAADEAVKANKCKYLARDRNYVAPTGFSLNHDLRNGAKGIDEWVIIDGGNTYVLKNYKWVNGENSSRQLHVDFDTLLCE